MWITIALLGLAGGIVSTLIGFGGGMILAVAFALTVSPLAALAVASLALLSGNIHRAFMFRHELRISDAYKWALGIAVGSVTGGLFVHHLPDWLLRSAFVVAAVIALLPRKSRASADNVEVNAMGVLMPAGGAIGFIGAGTAGVGPLASSTLVATGHVGERYIALMAITGVALNAGRIVGYGSSGALEAAWLSTSVVAALGLLVGNVIGKRIRHLIPAQRMTQLQRGIPFACLGLALLGLAT